MTPRKVVLPPVEINPEELAQRLMSPAQPKPPYKVVAHRADRPLKIGEIEIPCYVLDNEMRVLSQRGAASALTVQLGGSARDGEMPLFMTQNWLKPFIHADLLAVAKFPIPFANPQAPGVVYGYQAELLPELCAAIIEANRQGATTSRQEGIVERASILLRGFAKVGIIALIDEATGYQRVRAERALAEILKEYLSEELQPWVRTFPYEFYEQLYRLREWGEPAPNGKMPSAIGRDTVDLVYSRLAPGVYEEVTARTPRLSGGELKWRLSRWFSPNQGHAKLRKHIDGVIVLMKSSIDWKDFKTRLPKVYRKYHDTRQLTLDLKQKSQRDIPGL